MVMYPETVFTGWTPQDSFLPTQLTNISALVALAPLPVHTGCERPVLGQDQNIKMAVLSDLKI